MDAQRIRDHGRSQKPSAPSDRRAAPVHLQTRWMMRHHPRCARVPWAGARASNARRFHHVRNLREAGFVLVVVELGDGHVGGQHTFIHRERHDGRKHLQQFAVLGQACFPDRRTQVDATAESFAPSGCAQVAVSRLFRRNLAQHRFVHVTFEFGGNRIVEFGQQAQHRGTLLRILEWRVQDFRQPFLRQRRIGADRQRGQHAMHAIQQHRFVGIARVPTQITIEHFQLGVIDDFAMGRRLVHGSDDRGARFSSQVPAPPARGRTDDPMCAGCGRSMPKTCARAALRWPGSGRCAGPGCGEMRLGGNPTN